MNDSNGDEYTIPPIWVVNLKRSTARRDYITQHLAELDLRFELVEGVDGRLLTQAALADVYHPDLTRRLIRRPLTVTEIGCSLSHLSLYERMVRECLAEVIIMDDDAAVQPGFFEVLQHRADLPADWELVLLYHEGAQQSFWKRNALSSQYDTVKFVTVANGTVCYMLRLSAARKLLAHGYPVRMPSDHLIGGGIRTGVKLYGIEPPCVRELAQGMAAVTTMPDAHTVRLKPPTRDQLGPLLWSLRRVKICLLGLYRRFNPLSIIGGF